MKFYQENFSCPNCSDQIARVWFHRIVIKCPNCGAKLISTNYRILFTLMMLSVSILFLFFYWAELSDSFLSVTLTSFAFPLFAALFVTNIYLTKEIEVFKNYSQIYLFGTIGVFLLLIVFILINGLF